MEITPKIGCTKRRRRRPRRPRVVVGHRNQYVDLHWHQLLAAPLADGRSRRLVAGRPNARRRCVHEHIHQPVGGDEVNG